MADETRDLEAAVAIVGMAGRFPGARDLEEFWRNLRAGVESVRFLSRRGAGGARRPRRRGGRPRLRAGRWRCSTASTSSTPPFFGISHREAEIMDPQQRLFLESCLGGARGRRATTRLVDVRRAIVGVFGGATTSTYLLFNLVAQPPRWSPTVDPLQLRSSATTTTSLATRVSYKLEPARAEHDRADAPARPRWWRSTWPARACSTSECDMALAGGVSISVPQRRGYLLPGGRDPLAGRPLPGLRRRGAAARSSAAAWASWC